MNLAEATVCEAAPAAGGARRQTRLSVCIATYRRTPRLAALLDDLAQQELPADEVIVVDNDPLGSAGAVVGAACRAAPPHRLVYAVQPHKNIAITRNRTVELAGGRWLAFVDDDERAPPDWLRRLVEAAERSGADGVLGPVLPEVPPGAPAWIRRGRFYDWPRQPSGTLVPRNRLRFGNVLLRRELLGAAPFDPAYGLTGGEDGDLLARLAAAGASIVWCDEAAVREPIEESRLSLRWLLRRALRGGQDFARHSLNGRYGRANLLRRLRLVLRASAQLLAAALLALLSLPLGRHHAAHWLTRASANFGKLSVLWGWHYREYA
ncbi:MAG TPA: glycosyltransferase family 2 protein [Nevskia sp.]|nr:glycosyltransferase family 2 protein [Nevskia sp.]